MSFRFHKKNKPRERFYLLPGQGGINYWRKQKFFLGWAIVVALVAGGILALVMWRLAGAKP